MIIKYSTSEEISCLEDADGEDLQELLDERLEEKLDKKASKEDKKESKPFWVK